VQTGDRGLDLLAQLAHLERAVEEAVVEQDEIARIVGGKGGNGKSAPRPIRVGDVGDLNCRSAWPLITITVSFVAAIFSAWPWHRRVGDFPKAPPHATTEPSE
jgi:hypothetical protein